MRWCLYLDSVGNVKRKGFCLYSFSDCMDKSRLRQSTVHSNEIGERQRSQRTGYESPGWAGPSEGPRGGAAAAVCRAVRGPAGRTSMRLWCSRNGEDIRYSMWTPGCFVSRKHVLRRHKFGSLLNNLEIKKIWLSFSAIFMELIFVSPSNITIDHLH